MKLVLLFLSFSIVGQLYAQSETEVSLFSQNTLFYDNWYIWHAGIQYKHHLKGNWLYRLSIGMNEVDRESINSHYYFGHDTTYATDLSNLEIHMPVLTGGIERQHKISKRFKWYYGADINIGYNLSKKDSVSIQYTYGKVTGYTPTDTSVQTIRRRENMLFTSLQPFIGIKARWQCIGIGLESSLLCMEDLFIIDKKKSTLLQCIGYNVRLSASYYFEPRRKKADKLTGKSSTG